MEDSRKMERGRGRELGEEKGVINKSLISSVSSPPTSFPYHSETRSAQTYPPQAACRSGLIILTVIGRRLICCSGSPVCQNGDSSHQVPGQSQSGRTGSHTTNMLQLISLMPGAKTAHKSWICGHCKSKSRWQLPEKPSSLIETLLLPLPFFFFVCLFNEIHAFWVNWCMPLFWTW